MSGLDSINTVSCQDKLADPRTRSSVVAGALLWGANLVQLVPVCYEVHSLSMDHSTWVGLHTIYTLHSQSLMGRVTAKLPQYAGVPHCDARVDIQLVPGVALHGHVPPRRVPLGVQRAPAPHRLDGPGTTSSMVWMTG